MASALFLRSLPANFNNVIIKTAGQSKIAGRFEIASRSPLVILDGGHNPQAVRTLVKELNNFKFDGKKFVIFAAFDDKDVASMLVSLAKHADHFIFTSSGNRRSFEPSELERIYKGLLADNMIGHEVDYQIFNDIATSLKEALKLACQDDAVIVAGSLSNIGPVKEYLCSAGSIQR
jgi:dihydrofolate synthase/folylpolyglutamate synthase